VRYEPSVVVHHTEPGSWGGLLARRFHYGTSAGPLARRHGRHLAPVELRPWPTLVAAAVLTGRAGVAVAGLAASTVAMDRSTGGRGIPLAQALRWSAGGAGWTLVGIGRAATMLAGPAVAATALLGRRGRMTSALLVLTPPAVEWCRRRPRLDPVRWTVHRSPTTWPTGRGMGGMPRLPHRPPARPLGPLVGASALWPRIRRVPQWIDH